MLFSHPSAPFAFPCIHRLYHAPPPNAIAPDGTLYLDFHYCPLVKAWQKAGCTDEEIARLCDIAMCGDHGIGKCFDARLELPKAIAKQQSASVHGENENISVDKLHLAVDFYKALLRNYPADAR